MSTYEYVDTNGVELLIRPSVVDGAFVKASGFNSMVGVRVNPADAPAVAAALLNAAGSKHTILEPATTEVSVIGDNIMCGSSTVTMGISPEMIRRWAAQYLAIADYKEAEAQRESAAEQRLQKRREAVLAAILPEAAAAKNLPKLDELSVLDKRALDRIIALEDGQANR